MTERLYYADPYLKDWQARVVERVTVAGGPAVVLDRTAFYPGGGGQPEDRGTIDQARVTGSIEDGDRIAHLVDSAPGRSEVQCALDWPRRYDLMRQHTAQHILSEAFIRVLNAPTVSFHLSEDSATIDVPIPVPSADRVDAVERLANEVVAGGTPIEVRWFEAGEAIPLPLRKQPEVPGTVRIVSVRGFDHSPCGGVHCAVASEVQIIKISRLERRGQETRVHFASGGRAVTDYGVKIELVSGLAKQLSVGEADLAAAVGRLIDETKALRKDLQAAQESLIDLEAQGMLAEAEPVGRVRMVARVVAGADAERVKHLARRVADSGSAVALLAAATDKVHLVFVRSDDVDADMAELLRLAASAVGGSGGGRPSLAQGGGPNVSRASDAVRLAAEQLRSWLMETPA